MTRTITLLALLLLATPALADDKPGSVTWGDSQEEVKKKFPEAVPISAPMRGAALRVAGHKQWGYLGDLTFYFDADKLYHMQFSVRSEEDDRRPLIFKDLTTKLNSAYGEPTSTSRIRITWEKAGSQITLANIAIVSIHTRKIP